MQYIQKLEMPIPENKRIYPIPENDWKRLKRLLNNTPKHNRIFMKLSDLCLGIFASSLVALVILYGAKENVKIWSLKLHWIIMIMSLILTITLFYVNKENERTINKSNENILSEMKDIEESFYKDERHN